MFYNDLMFYSVNSKILSILIQTEKESKKISKIDSN